MEENWNISFDGGFFDNHSKKRGGKEVAVKKDFIWDGQQVYIPSIYICSKGLIIDILLAEDKEKIWQFIKKFNLINDEYGRSLTKDERDALDRENPLHFSFNSAITVNKKYIRQNRGSSCSWIPDLPEEFGSTNQAKEILEYYGMDKEKAWSIHRISFEWATVRKPTIKNLAITLSANEHYFPAEHFKNPAKGDKYTVTDPTNGNKYSLSILEVNKKNLGNTYFAQHGNELPKNFTVIAYTMDPDIPAKTFHLDDCIEPDCIRTSPSNKKQKNDVGPEASAIGIIGGIDGPVAILETSVPNKRTATSSVHFDSEYDVEWRAMFHKKMKADVSIKII